jgi:hypothetical protein
MTNRIVWHIVACVTAITLFPTSSRAQSPATTFDDLRLAVKDGNQVVVTDANGKHTRGKIATVTASSLDLAIERSKFLILREHSQRTFTDTDVTRVTRIDSRREGGIIGFLAGFVPIVVAACSGEKDSPDALYCDEGLVFAGPAFGLVGAAIGMWIDGRMNQIVYRTAAPVRPVTITLSPLLKPKSAGASLRLRF